MPYHRLIKALGCKRYAVPASRNALWTSGHPALGVSAALLLLVLLPGVVCTVLVVFNLLRTGNAKDPEGV
jgi:hypothetical protein